MTRLAHRVVDEVVLVNVTVPLGLVPPAVKAGVTVAVKVTCWFTAEELGEDTSVVVVLAEVTISETVPAVPAEKFWSPL
jgi:hypothetical protein